MEIRANYIMVGAFTLIVLLAGVAFTLWIGSQDKGVPMALYDISFNESVKGLSVNNDVLFSGIRVGKVSDIKISRVTPGEVRVRISIASDTPVRENSIAQLDLRGITGVSVISISGGTAESPLVQIPESGVGIIRYEPSTLTSVVNQVPDVLASANQILTRMDAMFSEQNAQAVTEILTSLAQISTTFADRADSINTILLEAENISGHVDQLLENTNNIVGKDIKSATASMSSASRRIDSTLKSMEPGLKQFSGQGLTDMRMLMVEMRNLVHILTRVGQKLESDPRRFLFGDQVKEYSN